MLKTYDALFVIDAANTEDALEPMLARVRSEIVRLDGEVTREEILGKRPFARPMHKRDQGIYVRLRFQLAPEQVDGLRKRYKLVDALMRVQVLAVDARREVLLAEQAERRAAHAEAAEAAGQPDEG